ncbi:hypothetical protein AGDE_13665 [Angomonas deanei]|uniref:Uncharacterized protein n=1 Tax=Angomonas deanei TaxID=59799 RepID=A0A7G2CJS7_9TRYP|nr:hypothetical protein AGDE_13665 [Angomonas deanei]CAD2220118.1 hypothetical protein, conserved [Angomonas deanei]|eukprot:EPY21978.1 hypothetical protein AGDE_13665 [Angomonas deanei]
MLFLPRLARRPAAGLALPSFFPSFLSEVGTSGGAVSFFSTSYTSREGGGHQLPWRPARHQRPVPREELQEVTAFLRTEASLCHVQDTLHIEVYLHLQPQGPPVLGVVGGTSITIVVLLQGEGNVGGQQVQDGVLLRRGERWVFTPRWFLQGLVEGTTL